MPVFAMLLNLSFAASLVLVVPGPTNTLLLSSGIMGGLRRSWHLIIAESLGYITAICLWGFSLSALAAHRHWLLNAIKLFCSLYLLWMALQTWRSGQLACSEDGKGVGFGNLFVATLTNPKALLFASVIFPDEAFHSLVYFAWSMFAFLIVLLPIGLGWIGLGDLLRSRQSLMTHTSSLLVFTSILLAIFSGSLIYSTLSG